MIVNCIPVIRNAFVTWWQSRRRPRRPEQNAPADEQREEHLSTFFDHAKILNHGKFLDRIVDDVKSLRNALVTMIIIIPCWFTIYQVDQIEW